jgi:hypothetical protein
MNRFLALLLLISLSAAAQEFIFRDGFENLPPAECRSRAVTFRVASTVGTAGAPAEWPGGTDIRSLEPRCSVTVARPSGPVDAGGDAFEVVRFTGYSHCFGAGGQDDDGCSVRTCPAAELGACTESRPQCPAAADGSSEATFRVRCGASDWTPVSYVENLLVKERMREWTRGEGLVATLGLLAGETDSATVIGTAEVLNPDWTGILSMAQEYLGDGTDPAAQAEIARLLEGIVLTIDRLDAMAGTAAPTASAKNTVAGGPTAQVDCTAFFNGYNLAPGISKCLEKDSFTVNGKEYHLYAPDPSLPQAGWTGDHYMWVKQAITDSVTKYDLLGTAPTFKAPPANVVFSVAKLKAKAKTAGSFKPCLVLIFTGAQLKGEPQFKQLVAHEIAHCLQGAVYPAQAGVGRKVRKWWTEGLADYWSNWVYPDVNLEWDSLETLQSRELATTVVERDYDNFAFFQHLANVVGNQGIIDLVHSLHTFGSRAAQAAKLSEYGDMATIYHDFVEALSDRTLRDTSSSVIPYTIGPLNQWSINVTGRWQTEEDLDAFGVLRYLLVTDPDLEADMTSFKQGEKTRASAKPPASGEWGEVPVTLPHICLDSQVVATSTKPGGRFDFDIDNLRETPGRCVLEGTWVVDNDSLNVTQIGFQTDYVKGEIRGTFHEDGTVDVVYNDWEWRVSETYKFISNGVEVEFYQEFTHTINAQGSTTYEATDRMSFGGFWERDYLVGTDTRHWIKRYTPPIFPDFEDTTVLTSPLYENVFSGSPRYELDGTLRFLDPFGGDDDVILHQVGDGTP